TLLLDPNDPTANYNMGLIHLQERLPKEALVYLENARGARAEDPAVLYHLARCYFELGQRERGLEAVRASIRAQPGDVTHLSIAGNLLVENGYYDSAVETLLKAAKLSRGEPGVLLNLSLAYAHFGEIEKALKFVVDSLDSF